MSERIPIVLESIDSYDTEKLKRFFDVASGALGFDRGLSGATVLLKPNLISARAPRLACSDGRYIRAAAEWFIDHGARVKLGDSPAFGSAAQVLQKQGITAQLHGLDVDLCEFTPGNPLQFSHGVKAALAREALDCDLLVNLPRVKAHSQMYVTIAVKNMFGIVCGMRKAVLHMKNGLSHRKFGDLMIDLSGAVGRSVTLVDGIETMHRTGPVNGESLEVGCVGAAADPVALDTALLSVLELESKRSPVWRAAEARGLPGADISCCDFVREAPARFRGSGFEAPKILNPVPFNPLRFLYSSLRRLAEKHRN